MWVQCARTDRGRVHHLVRTCPAGGGACRGHWGSTKSSRALGDPVHRGMVYTGDPDTLGEEGGGGSVVSRRGGGWCVRRRQASSTGAGSGVPQASAPGHQDSAAFPLPGGCGIRQGCSPAGQQSGRGATGDGRQRFSDGASEVLAESSAVLLSAWCSPGTRSTGREANVQLQEGSQSGPRRSNETARGKRKQANSSA